ncbi:hypothetical protein vseg_003921 [Gypsophila vaccaria]
MENTQENTPKKQKTTNHINETVLPETYCSNNDNNKEERSMVVKLYSPKVSKICEIMAWGDQRVDLGSVSRMFGIEPRTLKFNGHFISRGVDLIATCVTWNTLLSFFSSKGLGTGVGGSPALVVDGSLSRIGYKRAHELQPEVDEGVHCSIQQCEEGVGGGRYSNYVEINSPDSKKLKTNDFGRDSQTSRQRDGRLKRQPSLEDTNTLKRVRVSGSYSRENTPGRGVNDGAYISRLHCGYQMSENMKRLREDEVIAAACFKRTR